MDTMSQTSTKRPLAELFRLDGRVALITGAGGHLGRAISSALASAGAHVVLAGRSAEPLERLHQEILADGGAATALSGDVTDDGFITTLNRWLERQVGRLDILVNNAYAGRTGGWLTVARDDVLTAANLVVASTLRLVQVTSPLLRSTAREHLGGSSVINIASMYGIVSPDPQIYGRSGLDSPPHYGAAKAGLLQLTRHLAVHLAPDRIRVNAIAPGPFPPPQIRADHPEFIDALRAKVPLGRVGDPSELRGAALFLASDAASFVTGNCITVDGGWTSW